MPEVIIIIITLINIKQENATKKIRVGIKSNRLKGDNIIIPSITTPHTILYHYNVLTF
jgi:hypothetical protein